MKKIIIIFAIIGTSLPLAAMQKIGQKKGAFPSARTSLAQQPRTFPLQRGFPGQYLQQPTTSYLPPRKGFFGTWTPSWLGRGELKPEIKQKTSGILNPDLEEIYDSYVKNTNAMLPNPLLDAHFSTLIKSLIHSSSDSITPEFFYKNGKLKNTEFLEFAPQNIKGEIHKLIREHPELITLDTLIGRKVETEASGLPGSGEHIITTKLTTPAVNLEFLEDIPVNHAQSLLEKLKQLRQGKPFQHSQLFYPGLGQFYMLVPIGNKTNRAIEEALTAVIKKRETAIMEKGGEEELD